MPLEKCFEQALHSVDPAEELRQLAERLSSQGHDRAAVLSMFEKARSELREDAREAEEDVLMDVMDRLVSWCAPGAEIPARSSPANGTASQPSGADAPKPRSKP